MRANPFKAGWQRYLPVKPSLIGRREIRHADLAELAQYVDWAPFFQTWELSGPFPAILDDAVVGEAARSVYAEGQAMLRDIIQGRWLTANEAIALMSANAVGDNIEVYADEAAQRASRSPGATSASRTNARRASPTIVYPTSSRRRSRA